jgi:hypothetical protein
MVEIRVAVPFDGARDEVRLRSEWDSRASSRCWHTNGLSPRDREEDRPPMNRPTGNADARVPHDVPRFPRQRHELTRAVIGEDGPAIHSWENEGGSYSNTDEPALEAVPVKHLPPGSSGTCS